MAGLRPATRDCGVWSPCYSLFLIALLLSAVGTATGQNAVAGIEGSQLLPAADSLANEAFLGTGGVGAEPVGSAGSGALNSSGTNSTNGSELGGVEDASSGEANSVATDFAPEDGFAGGGEEGVEGPDLTPETGIFKLGAVLSTKGRYRQMEEAKNGYQMFVNYYNDIREFGRGIKIVDKSGRQYFYKFNFTIYEDNSDSFSHFQSLSRLLTRDKVDFLLGSHPGFAETEAAYSDRLKKINLHCCAESDKLYTKNERRHVFGVTVSNRKYPELAMKSLFDNYQRVGIVYDSEQISICESAREIAIDKNLTLTMYRMIRNEEGFVNETVVDDIVQDAKDTDVEVFVACAFEDDGRKLLEAFHKVKYSTKMFFLSGPVDDQFLKDMGNKAHHIVTAGQWHPSMRFDDDFSSLTTKQYVELYKQFYKKTPSHLSAGASVAIEAIAYALQKAFENCDIEPSGADAQQLLFGTGVLRGCEDLNGESGYERVRSTMNRIIMKNTFYGPVEFDKFRRNDLKDAATMQVLCNKRPCKEDDTNHKLEVVLPINSATASLVLPAPNRYKESCQPGHFEQLEECFPCPPGRFSVDGSGFCEICGRGEYNNDTGSTSCDKCPEGSSSGAGSFSIQNCTCVPGYYSSDGTGAAGTCLKCPRGGECQGDVAFPIPLDGYWSDINAAERQHRAETYECGIAERCLGGQDSLCLKGYTGRLCQECDNGHFGFLDKCYKCFSKAGVVFVILSLFLLWYLINAVFAQNVESLEMILNWAQLANVIGDVNLRWPKVLTQLFGVANIMDFDVDILEPSCLVEWSFSHNMLVQLILPVFMSLMSLAGYWFTWSLYRLNLRSGGRLCYDKNFKWLRLIFNVPEDDMEMDILKDRMIARSIASVEVTYLTIAKYCFDAFRCETIAGVRVLQAAPEIQCGTSEHAWVMALGVLGLVFYVFGYVIFVVYKLVRFWFERSFSEPTNLRRFGFLYQHYEIEYYWTEVIVFLRRLLFVCVLVNGTNPAIQVAILALLIIASLLLHVYTAPYVDTYLDVLFSILLVALMAEAFSGLLFYNTDVSDRSKKILEIMVVSVIFLLWVVFGVIFIIEVVTKYKVDNLRTLHSKVVLGYRSFNKRHRDDTCADVKKDDLMEQGEDAQSDDDSDKVSISELRRVKSKISDELYYTFDTAFLYRSLSNNPEMMHDWDDLTEMLKDYMSNQSETSYLSLEPVARFWRKLVERFPEVVDFLAVVDENTRMHFREFVMVLYRDFYLKKGLEMCPIFKILNWRDRAPMAQWLAMAPEQDRHFFSKVMLRMFDAARSREATQMLRMKIESQGREYVDVPFIAERAIPSLGWRRTPTFNYQEQANPFAHSALKRLRSGRLALNAAVKFLHVAHNVRRRELKAMMDQADGLDSQEDNNYVNGSELQGASSTEYEDCDSESNNATTSNSSRTEIVAEEDGEEDVDGSQVSESQQEDEEDEGLQEDGMPVSQVKMSSTRQFWVSRTKRLELPSSRKPTHTFSDLGSIQETLSFSEANATCMNHDERKLRRKKEDSVAHSSASSFGS